jgi:hypothetical protein
MALKLIANYSKRLGLPGYSSHQFSVSCETEITNVDDVREESARLYETLQAAVDEQMQSTGFVPDAAYGSRNEPAATGSSRVNGSRANGRHNGTNGEPWRCSDKQRELILKLIDEHHLDKGSVEALAQDMFGAGVRQLNRLQASGLIDHLIDEHGGGKRNGRAKTNGRAYANGGAR